MLGLMRRKVSVLHQTRTSNLCDLLERILSKGMVISGGKYLAHGWMDFLYRTNTRANGSSYQKELIVNSRKSVNAK